MATTLGGGRNKGDSTEQKRRGRARTAGNEEVTGVKPHQSGSSGNQLFMSRVHKHTFAEIEAEALHVGDAVAIFNDIRKTPSKAIIVGLTAPASYQVELMNMMDACAMGFVMIRCYYVPRAPFMVPAGDDLDQSGAA